MCNVAELNIAGRKCVALIDSGAVVSLVKPSVAQGFKIRRTEDTLVDIQGKRIPSVGEVLLPLSFKGSVCVKHNFIVIDTDSFRADLLIGLDFLHKYGIKIDWGDEYMFAFEEQIPLGDQWPAASGRNSSNLWRG